MLDKEGIVFKEITGRFSLSLTAALSGAVKSWELFCNLPQKEKDRFTFTQFETDWADPGYRKKSSDQKFDDKDFFHVMSSNNTFLNMLGMNFHNIHPLARYFMIDAMCLQERLVKFITSNSHFSDICNNGSLESKLLQEVRFSQELITIRFLKYVPGIVGSEIATPHVDKCGMTIHLYSSHSGLQYVEPNSLITGPENVVWHDLEVPSGTVAMFGSYQAKELFKNQIQPLIHRVVQAATSEARYSVVAFVPFFSTTRFPKEKRIQDLMLQLGFFNK